MLDRIGPHDRSNELLRTITSSLADTRKTLGQGRERSSDDSPVARVAGQMFFSSLGSHAVDRPSNSQRDSTPRRGVDEILGVWGIALEARHVMVNGSLTLVENTPRWTEPQNDEAEPGMLGLDFDGLIQLLAHDSMGLDPCRLGR